MRHIIIGDIHGCIDELHDLLDKLAVTDDDVVISVGDLVDRGPDSPAVVRWFRDRANAIVLMGNHERKHVRGVLTYAQEITRLQFGERYREAVAWMTSLPYFLELPDAIVVHAAAMPGMLLADQKEEVLCGSTAGEKELDQALAGTRWHERWSGPKPIVFGHHVVEQPLVRPGHVYGIDTGACHGGMLTALVLPDFELVSIPARTDHWSVVKRTAQADVLATKPWAQLPWRDLDEQLAKFDRVDEPRARAYVDALRTWRRSLEARLHEVLAVLAAEAARVAPDAIKDHALAPLLFQHQRGRLDVAALRKNLPNPTRLEAAAATLGLPAISPPGTACRREA